MYTSNYRMNQESFLNNFNQNSPPNTQNQSNEGNYVRDELDIILRGQHNYENSLENLFENIDTSQSNQSMAIRYVVNT